MNCSSCGFGNPAAARFCGGCGLPIVNRSRPEAQAERRVISVIFCDIVGATALSEVIDPEDLRELLSSYHHTCSQVVETFDGFLADLMGDGVVIYFGYPKAHEDDECRAVRCALAIQQALHDLATKIRHPFQVRIGVHRGRVVVGALSGVAGLQSLAIGETPNIAARLQSEANPGEVVISDSLWRLVARFFHAEQLGSRRLKGIRRPVEIYRIIKPRPATHQKGLTAPFVGRLHEMGLIQSRWRNALAGQPQAVLIRGEPGIGKSRLIQQVVTHLNESDPVVLEASCSPFTIDTPFFPLADMLRNRLGLSKVAPAQHLNTLATRLASLGLDQPEALPLFALFLSLEIDPSQWPILAELSLARQRQRTLELLVQGLTALTQDAPVLLIVEDLHWADASTIELLDQVLSPSGGGRFLVILTARLEFHAAWKQQAQLTEIPLETLPAPEAERVIRNVASNKALPPELVRLICQRADGNPLFLEEITLSVLASALVIERDTTWELMQPFSADVVPASLEAALMARLDQLGAAKTLLQTGATLGREFQLDLLAAVASAEPAELEEVMQQLVEEGFLRLSDRAQPGYLFKHALVQDVAYQSLLRRTRQQTHARIAVVMAERFPDLAKKRPELMAHHLSGAGRYAEAAQLWLVAGQMAAGRNAVNEAVEHLNHGLVDLDQLPPDPKRWSLEFSLQSSLAPVQMAAYGWASPLVESTCRRATDLAERLAAGDQRFAPLWGLWSNQFVAGRLEAALESARQLFTLAQATGVTMHAIAARNAASYTHFYRGEYALAIEQADAGLTLYSRELELELCLTLQSAPTVHILSARANSLWMLGRQTEAHQGMARMLELARALHHPPSLAAALCYLCFFHYYDRNWQQILVASEEALRLSIAEGYALWHACADMYRAMARLALEPSASRTAAVLEDAQLFRQTASLVTDPSTATIIMAALQQSGRLEEALAESEWGASTAERGQVRVMVPEIFRCRGDVLAALGRAEEADQAYQRAVHCAREQAAASLEVRALTSLLRHRRQRKILPGVETTDLRQLLDRLPSDALSPDVHQARSLLAQAAERGVAAERPVAAIPTPQPKRF